MVLVGTTTAVKGRPAVDVAADLHRPHLVDRHVVMTMVMVVMPVSQMAMMVVTVAMMMVVSPAPSAGTGFGGVGNAHHGKRGDSDSSEESGFHRLH